MLPAVPPATPRITARNSPSLFKGRNIPTVAYTTLNKAVRKQLLTTSYEACILKTCFRRFTARKEKDRKTARLQEDHFRHLTKEVLAKQKEANEWWAALLTIIRNHKLRTSSVTAKQIEAISNSIWINGFPHLEFLLLKSFGLSDEVIHCMQLFQAVIPISMPNKKSKVSFVDVIDGIMEINTFEDICECRCLDC